MELAMDYVRAQGVTESRRGESGGEMARWLSFEGAVEKPKRFVIN